MRAAPQSLAPNALMGGTPDPIGTPGNLLTDRPTAQQFPEPSLTLRDAAADVASHLHQARMVADVARLGAVRDMLGGMLQDPKLTWKGAVDALTGAVRDGHLDPQTASREMNGIPTRGGSEKLRTWIADQYMAVSGAHAVGHHVVQAMVRPGGGVN